ALTTLLCELDGDILEWHAVERDSSANDHVGVQGHIRRLARRYGCGSNGCPGTAVLEPDFVLARREIAEGPRAIGGDGALSDRPLVGEPATRAVRSRRDDVRRNFVKCVTGSLVQRHA